MAAGKITRRTINAPTLGSALHFLWAVDLKGFSAKITYLAQYRLGGGESRSSSMAAKSAEASNM